MKWFKTMALAVVVTAAALAATGFMGIKLLKKAPAGAKGFAVVELYTSEGCSSCPPADELVAKIEKETAGTPVYILAYHVDYWDRLGWKDAFSSADFSKRQNEYARYLHLQSVYTPQIVVNGKTEMVGSQEGTLRSAIRAGLQKPASAVLSLSVVKSDKNEVSVKYTAEGADKNSVLLIALVQKHAQTKVMRGENAGHTLSHVQIVSKLQRVPLTGQSACLPDRQEVANITIPKGTENHEVIGFIQNTTTGAITAAGRAALMPEVSASAAR